MESLTIVKIASELTLYDGLEGPPIGAESTKADGAARSANQAETAKPAIVQSAANTKLILRTMNSECADA